MSLGRACLRLAAVAALRDATIAGPRVFDSRIGAIDAFVPEEFRPAVVVYTEEEAGEPLSSQNGGPPFRPHVELVFEIAMLEALYDTAQTITDIGCPTTDAELEAALDALEGQIKAVLFEDMTRPLATLFRRAYRRVHHYQSLRFREEVKTTRFARRYIVLKCEIADEPVFAAYDAALAGFDLLPPTFRAIASAWPEGLPEKAVALAMANAFQQPGVSRGLTVGAAVTINGDPATRTFTSLLRP